MKIRPAGPTAVVIMGLVMLASLYILSGSARDAEQFGVLYSGLVLVNIIGLVIFIGLIAANIRQLLRDLRNQVPGIKLKVRVVLMFVTLSIMPVAIVYGFSLDFLQRGIDSWFDVRVETALDDALELSKRSLELRMRDTLQMMREMASELTSDVPLQSGPLNLDALRNPDSTVVANVFSPGVPELDRLRNRSGAEELELLDQNGNLLAASGGATNIVPQLPSRSIILQLAQRRDFVELEPLRDTGLYIRAAVRIDGPSLSGNRQILHGLFPVPGRLNNLATSVQEAFANYNELVYLRDRLKISFIMTLTLVLAFGVLMAIWAAFYAADRLAAPVRDLAAGTRAVAEGNYATSLRVTSNDELGFLVQSFNDMTRRVAKARDEVEAQRRYLETVLGKLSSGVLVLNHEHQIIIGNDIAGQILGVDSAVLRSNSLDETTRSPVLTTFMEGIREHLVPDANDWQEQVVVFGDRRKILMCSGTTLVSEESANSDFVVVFDDVTSLVQSQREAAWGDVARRLAHEIKNPLTPIQLATERLRYKYLNSSELADKDLLDRLTSTIIQQVETMKGMVNTFSDYARPPVIKPEPLDLNALISSVVELYSHANPAAQISADLEEQLPLVQADGNRLRQVFNNLIKNALEATPEGQAGQIAVSTRNFSDAHLQYIEVRIDDRGTGINQDLLDTIFEPYVTNKPKGTGLGLAIVKKIVEEHGGIVIIENREEGGASAILRLPLPAAGEVSVTESRRQSA